MTFETRQAYAEICEVLQYMPKEYVQKIPEKMIKLFQTEKLENYEVNINKSNPLDNNYLSKETLVLIAVLNYQYWCPNKKVKGDLYQMYSSNNEKYQKEIEEKYNPDNMFVKKKQAIENMSEQQECKELTEYKEENFFRKVLRKIKSIFKSYL